MTERRKPALVLPVAVTLAALLGLYVGAYYWAVMPFLGSPAYPFRFEGGRVSAWRHDGPLPTFFAPIHWLDRRLRPRVWE